jgi:hypothetical protein
MTYRLISVTLTVAVLTAGVLLETPGAQKLDIETNTDPKADFTTIRTYAWREPAKFLRDTPPDALSNPTLSDEALAPHIVAAVDQQMKARGIVKVEPDVADVHIAYLAAITTKTNSSYLGEHYGYITGWGSPVPAGMAPTTSLTGYQKGTIVIDVIQRSANRAIWRGSVGTKVAEGRKLEDRVKRIHEAVNRIFERFPIRRRG